jgi:tetratricopeptide (TPR) repeat protein
MLQIRPDDADLHYNLGLLYQEQKDYPRALEELEAAARLRPQDQEVAQAVLEALLAAGRDKQALAQARRMLKARPQDLGVIDRIYPRLSRKRPRALARLLDWRLKQGKVPVKYYKLRAALALEQEDTKGAIAALARGVRAWPRDLGLRLRLAELYDAQGQEAKALAQLDYIMDQDPEFPGAEELYLQIKTRTLKEKKSHTPAAASEGLTSPPSAAEPPLPRETITPTGGSSSQAEAGEAEPKDGKGGSQAKVKPAPPAKAKDKAEGEPAPKPGDKTSPQDKGR